MIKQDNLHVGKPIKFEGITTAKKNKQGLYEVSKNRVVTIAGKKVIAAGCNNCAKCVFLDTVHCSDNACFPFQRKDNSFITFYLHEEV